MNHKLKQNVGKENLDINNYMTEFTISLIIKEILIIMKVYKTAVIKYY